VVLRAGASGEVLAHLVDSVLVVGTGSGIPVTSQCAELRASTRYSRLIERALLASVKKRVVEHASGLRAEDRRDNRAPEPVHRG
jgi:hypothetical protein